jgi:cell division protein FtsX
MPFRLLALALASLLAVACSGGDAPEDGATAATGGCKPHVVVYLDAGVSEARQSRVGRLLEEQPEVETIEYHSPEEAFREFKRVYRGQPEILEGRTVDDFPGFYDVTLSGQDAFASFEASLVGAVGIDKLVPGGCGGPEGPATP